jgi:hypothetical protein
MAETGSGAVSSRGWLPRGEEAVRQARAGALAAAEAAMSRDSWQWQSSRARCRTRSRGRSSWQAVVVEDVDAEGGVGGAWGERERGIRALDEAGANVGK